MCENWWWEDLGPKKDPKPGFGTPPGPPRRPDPGPLEVALVAAVANHTEVTMASPKKSDSCCVPFQKRRWWLYQRWMKE